MSFQRSSETSVMSVLLMLGGGIDGGLELTELA
jgi:hypothetical protein